MTPAKIYNVVVPAGGAFQLQARGEYFKLLSASGELEVRGDTFGTIGQLQSGQGLSSTPFARIELRDLSGYDNRVSVVVAGEAFVDDRIAGSVEVIEGGRVRTDAGRAFIGGLYVAPGVANISQGLLWNPVGSGRAMVVSKVAVGSQSVTGVGVGFCAVQFGAPGGFVSSKKTGGGGSVASWYGSAAMALQTSVQLLSVTVAAGGFVVYKFDEPAVVAPGMGVSFWTDRNNVDVRLSVEFFEEVL